ncbi:MAG: 3'-5' exonuclease [Thalassotalea sp.]
MALAVCLYYLLRKWYLHIESSDARKSRTKISTRNSNGRVISSSRDQKGRTDKAIHDLMFDELKEFVVVDLETTGLDSQNNRIIEFGALRVQANTTEVYTFQALIKPDKDFPIPEHITEITGISTEIIEDEGRAITDVLPEFIDFIGDLPIVAYNAKFDIAFLKAECSRQNIILANEPICALEKARIAWPNLPSYKLVDMAKRGGINIDSAHRALKDCQITLTIFNSANVILKS